MRVVAAARILLAALAWASAAAASDDYRIHGRTVPPGYEREAAFFELVKWPTDPIDRFDANGAPHWDLSKIGEYISADGIDFSDVNHRLDGRKTKQEILGSLKQRKGELFQAFAHLSHIYAIPYKQYSELSFEKSGDIAVVTMAGWYQITFRRDIAASKIIRWEYNQMEGH